MLLGFRTDDEITAKASLIVYAIYRSRDKKRAPSGMDMWSQIERFAKSCAKRSVNLGEFANKFKKKMACGTINPIWLRDDINSVDARSFGIDILDGNADTQKAIVDKIYNETILIIMLVRDRLEREKTAGTEREEDII